MLRLNDSYAQWVRRTIERAGLSVKPPISLFDSSVPEPTALLREVVAEAFAEPISSRYVSAFMGGNVFALDAIAQRYDVPRDAILGTSGATSAISLIYRALLAPGDHVLVENPGFDMFASLAAERGAAVDTFSRKGDRFVLDLQEIEAAIRPDTKLIVLSNLHNPSGMQVDRDDLKTLARIVEARGVTAIIDEVYADYAGADAAPAAKLSSAFISVSSLTKIYGLSTLRCGWIIAAPDLMSLIRIASDRAELSISNLSHAVAALVLERADRFTDYWGSVLSVARPIMADRLASWEKAGIAATAMPDHGCIVFPRLINIEDTAAFAEWLADRSGVIVAPGEFFGEAGRIRIGFGRDPASLERGLDALEEGLQRYRSLSTGERARA